MKKNDEWIVIRVSVAEAREIEKAMYARYSKFYLDGQKTYCLKMLNIWKKITKLLEIEP